MAGVAARNCSILVDEWDFSTVSSGASLEIPVETQESPTLQMTALEMLPTVPGMAKLEHNGYYTGEDAGKLEYEMYQRLGTATPAYVAALLDTTALVNPAYVLASSWNSQLNIAMPSKQLITLQGAWSANPVRRGYTLQNGVISAVASQVAQDFGAAGSAGCTAYLFVRAIAGVSTGITVQLQGATALAFGTPVTLGTWANFTTVGCKVLTVASGTVHRYLRLNVTGLGGATSFTMCAVVCVPGVTEQ